MFERGVEEHLADLSTGGDTGLCADMNEIVELAKQISLHEVNVKHVEKIVQETASSLSNDELKELADQEEHKNIESSDSEEEKKNFQQRF
ncbi:hypothetical protein TNCT_646371 [Trichonephila clavata]|uniref:Uncharacterized protein n=1 Tax=Trichonephila clavata TaxID=2740835 RepID=A0A8X6HM85_TRICU|nr:hypothetical protein TNCT_646371 [Trichonephila clavata]